MRMFSGFCLCLLVLVFFGRFQEIFLFLVPLQLGKVGVLLGLIAVLASAPHTLLSFVKDTPFGKWMIFLLALAFVGIPFSVWPGDSLKDSIAYSRQLLIVSIMVGLSMQCGARALRFSCMLAVGMMALMMVLEKGTGRISVGARYDPNDIALLFNVFLPVIVAEALRGNNFWRPFAWGTALLAVIGIASTGSRGGILTLAAVGLHVLFAVKTRRWMLVPLLAIGVGLTLAVADDSLWERFGALRDDTDYNLSDKHGRLAIWGQGIDFIIRNPILGVGFGQFGSASFTYGLGPGVTAHNSFILIGTELGLPGLVAFIAILGALYRLSKKGANADFIPKADQLRFWVLQFSVTGFCVGGFFLSQAYGAILSTLLALGSVMFLQLRDAEQNAPAMEQKDLFEEETLPVPSGALKSPLPAGALTRTQKEALLSQGDIHARRRKGRTLQERKRAGFL